MILDRSNLFILDTKILNEVDVSIPVEIKIFVVNNCQVLLHDLNTWITSLKKNQNIEPSTVNLKIQKEIVEDIRIKILLPDPERYPKKLYDEINYSIQEYILPLIDLGVNIDFRYFLGHNISETICFTNGKKMWGIHFLENQLSILKNSIDIEDLTLQAESVSFLNRMNNKFDDYWGSKEIHTIVFDFDDTLAFTFEINLEAWLETILESIKQKKITPEVLNKKRIVPFIEDHVLLMKKVKEIFLENQMANIVFEKIFCGIKKSEIDLIKWIKEFRFNYRAKKTIESALLFEGAKDVLQNLSKNYRLVIISATSQHLIQKVLNRLGIEHLFFEVLGKLDPKPNFPGLSNKSLLLMNLQIQTGIPFNRMIFVGDNQKDYSAARQFNISFIEASMRAEILNRKTLINYLEEDNVYSFKSYKKNEGAPTILNHIESINLLMAKKKYL